MIISNSTQLNETIDESIHIAESSVLNAYGIINGNVYVESSATFNLFGTLNGDLYTSPNTKSYLYGTLNGSIVTNDGFIELSGLLNTKHPVSENVIKKSGCYINGTKF